MPKTEIDRLAEFLMERSFMGLEGSAVDVAIALIRQQDDLLAGYVSEGELSAIMGEEWAARQEKTE